MKTTRRFVARFPRDETGASAVEYGLLIAIIAAVIIVAALSFANRTQDLYLCTEQTIATKVPAC